jgi:4a-hydroxytetrahydrobiopterin dehydratase
MKLDQQNCVACEGNVPPLSFHEQYLFLGMVPAWSVQHNGIDKLERLFTFTDFVASMAFVSSVAELSEQQGHHPDIHISYSRVRIELYTHAVLGLTQNDFILAAKIDKIYDRT